MSVFRASVMAARLVSEGEIQSVSASPTQQQQQRQVAPATSAAPFARSLPASPIPATPTTRRDRGGSAMGIVWLHLNLVPFAEF